MAVAQLWFVRRHTMRSFFYILLAMIVLHASRGYSATDAKNAILAFYIVSDEKLDGGQFIDTLDFPKLGYIAAKPNFIITQLVAVSEVVTHSSMSKIGKDGKITAGPLTDDFALKVQILPADAQKFEVLTENSIGKRLLMMLGDKPLSAPRVLTPISTQSFQLTTIDRGKQKVIEDGLNKLVH